jgi:hypothetical protein
MSKNLRRQLVSALLLILCLNLTLPMYAARSRNERSGDGSGSFERILHRVLRIVRGFGDEIGTPRP